MIRILMLCWLTALIPIGVGRGAWGQAPSKGLPNGEFRVKLNGVNLWYRVSGRGPVCLMPTPGWGPSSDLYFRTLKPLEESLTIVYLDTRGTGRSDRAAAPTDYGWDHLVSDLDALRMHLKLDKIWLIGHSEGGMQILHYAVKYPERVSGLILLATMAAVRPVDSLALTARVMRRSKEPWFQEGLKAFQGWPGMSDEEMAARMKKLLPAYWADATRIEKHQEHFAATTMSVDAYRGQQASKRMPFDLAGELTKIHAPALIVAGDRDDFCPPSAAREMHLRLPNSKLLVIQDSGHFPWLEQAGEFTSQVPLFLQSLGLGGSTGG